jgi:hypothetical protein
MKYKAGDLINNKWGNVDHLGYITHVDEKEYYLTVVFFCNAHIKKTLTYQYFKQYYKVL